MPTENPSRSTIGETQVSRLQDEGELSPYQKYISKIREVVFTVGFNRSGSSLIGDLLTAHPNIVMSNEARVIGRYIEGEFGSREAMFCSIIKHNMDRKKRKNFVDCRYQDQYDCDIEVIGDKHSPSNTFGLTKEGTDILEQLEKLIKLPIKFLFTVRNPYDMISSMVSNIPDWEITEDEKIKKAISYFARCSNKNLKLLNRLASEQVFTIRLEDFIAMPKQQLADICDFLGTAKTPTYLSSCAAVTYKIPNRSRDRLDWSRHLRKSVDALIEKYEFFRGYGWDT